MFNTPAISFHDASVFWNVKFIFVSQNIDFYLKNPIRGLEALIKKFNENGTLMNLSIVQLHLKKINIQNNQVKIISIGKEEQVDRRKQQ